jgi:phosphosulfolactate phosphohydrolase-like enzyme
MAATLIEHEGKRLELICTGPGAQGSFIDLYVAGYIVEHLMHECPGAWVLNDSALTARSVYQHYLGLPYRCISDSLAEALLLSEGQVAAAQKACEADQYDIVAKLCNGAFINAS